MFDDESERKEQTKLNSAIARENAAIAELDKPTDDIIDDIPDVPKRNS